MSSAAAGGGTGAFFVVGASSAIFGIPSFKFSAGSSGTVACFASDCNSRFVWVFLSTTISSANLNFGAGLTSATAMASFWTPRLGRFSTVGSCCGFGSGELDASAAGGDDSDEIVDSVSGSDAAGVAVCCGLGLASGAAGMFLTGPVDSVLFSAAGFGFAATGAGLSAAGSGRFATGIFGVVAFSAVDLADCLGFASGAGGTLPGSMPNTSTATSKMV